MVRLRSDRFIFIFLVGTVVNYFLMKRVFDVCSVLLLSIVIFPLIVLIYLILKITYGGSVVYWSDRVGRNNEIFQMPKFRTMAVNTPVVASHLLDNPDAYVTFWGRILRKSSLDELPQLWSVLIGHMTLVGPRPALFNQYDLIERRTEKGINKLVPGLTGWAQVNGRDLISIDEKVLLDEFYMENMSILFDLKIIFKTLKRSTHSASVSH